MIAMPSVRALALLGSATAIIACASRGSVAPSAPVVAAPQAPNTLTAQERADGWRLLFDGTSMKGWRDYHADTISGAWSIVAGVITKTKSAEDIVTRESFGDFELSFDWKLPLRGNAGAFFRATEEYTKIYWSAPEFQLLDDSIGADGRNPLTSAGAAYGLYAPPRGIAKIGGNWNTSRIVAKGSHVEHWMNGQKTIEYEAWTPEWLDKVAKSKFHTYPNFGLAKSGLIGFQGDHNGSLELRNIKIRVLK